jgi:hypothetical protein
MSNKEQIQPCFRTATEEELSCSIGGTLGSKSSPNLPSFSPSQLSNAIYGPVWNIRLSDLELNPAMLPKSAVPKETWPPIGD